MLPYVSDSEEDFLKIKSLTKFLFDQLVFKREKEIEIDGTEESIVDVFLYFSL